MSLEIPSDHRVLDPTGNEVNRDGLVERASKMIVFSEPGIYRRIVPNGTESLLAVNLVESESNTSVGSLERLEKLGVVMTDRNSTIKVDDTRRQLRAVELESQQGWWRWVIVGVLGIIGLESLLCIRKAG